MVKSYFRHSRFGAWDQPRKSYQLYNLLNMALGNDVTHGGVLRFIGEGKIAICVLHKGEGVILG